MFTGFLVKLWRMIRGPLQWRVLWLAHSKFIAGISGIVLNADGNILLLRHRFWKRGSCGLPSGYAKSSERFEDTLAREVREETGLIIEVTSLLRIVTGYKLRFEMTFLARVTGGSLALNPNEIIGAEFFRRENLPEGLLASHRQIIELSTAGGDVAEHRILGASGTSAWKGSRRTADSQ